MRKYGTHWVPDRSRISNSLIPPAMKFWGGNVFSPVHLSVILLTVLEGAGGLIVQGPGPRPPLSRVQASRAPCTGPLPPDMLKLAQGRPYCTGTPPPRHVKTSSVWSMYILLEYFLAVFWNRETTWSWASKQKELFTETYTLLMSHQMWQHRWRPMATCHFCVYGITLMAS